MTSGKDRDGRESQTPEPNVTTGPAVEPEPERPSSAPPPQPNLRPPSILPPAPAKPTPDSPEQKYTFKSFDHDMEDTPTSVNEVPSELLAGLRQQANEHHEDSALHLLADLEAAQQASEDGGENNRSVAARVPESIFGEPPPSPLGDESTVRMDLHDLSAPPDAKDAPTMEPDRGAHAALRTVHPRRRRRETLPLVGSGQAVEERRRALLEALADTQEGPERAQLLMAAAEIAAAHRAGFEHLVQRAHEAHPSDVYALRTLRRQALRDGNLTSALRHVELETALPASQEQRRTQQHLIHELEDRLGMVPQIRVQPENEKQAPAEDPVGALLHIRRVLRQKNAHKVADRLRDLGNGAQAEVRRALLEVSAQWYESVGQKQQALTRLDEAQATEPDRSPPFHVGISRARLLLEQGDVAQTAEVLENLASHTPAGVVRDAIRHRIASVLQHERRDPAAAARKLEENQDDSSPVDPRISQLQIEGALLDGSTKQLGEHLAEANTRLSRQERALLWVELARLLNGEQDHEGAWVALQKASKISRNLASATMERERTLRHLSSQPGSDERPDPEVHIKDADLLQHVARVIVRKDDPTQEHGAITKAIAAGLEPEALNALRIDVDAPCGNDAGVAAGLREQLLNAPPEHRVGPGLALVDAADRASQSRTTLPLLEELAPLSAAAFLSLSQRYLRTGRPGKSAELWQRARHGSSTIFHAFRFRHAAQMLKEAGLHHQSALELCLKAIPDYPPALWADGAAWDAAQWLSAAEHTSSQELRARWLLTAADNQSRERSPQTRINALPHVNDDPLLAFSLLLSRTLMKSSEYALVSRYLYDRLTPTTRQSFAISTAEALYLGEQPETALKLLEPEHLLDADQPLASEVRNAILQDTGNGLDMAEALSDEARRAKASQRANLLLELAFVDEHIRGEPTTALTAYRAATQTMPDAPASAREHVVDALLGITRTSSGRSTSGEIWRLADHLPAGADARATRWLAMALMRGQQSVDAAHPLEDRDPASAQVTPEDGGNWLLRRHLERDDLKLEGRAKLLEMGAQRASEGPERTEATLRAAEHWLEAGHPERAVDLLQGPGVQLEGHSFALETLAKAVSQTGEWSAAHSIRAKAASSAYAPERSARLWYECGASAEHNIRDLGLAITAWKNVLAIDPMYRDAASRLTRCLKAEGRTDELAHVLEDQLLLSGDDEHRRQVLLQITQIQFDQGNLPLAREARLELLKLDSNDVESLRVVCELELELELWTDAASHLVQLAQHRRNREELRWTFQSLANLYIHHMPDPTRAIAALKRLRKISPNDLHAMEQLADLYKAQGDLGSEVEVLHDMCRHEQNVDTVVQHHLRIIDRMHQQGDRGGVVEHISLVRKRFPTVARAIQGIEAFYVETGAGGAREAFLRDSVHNMQQRLLHAPTDPSAWFMLGELCIKLGHLRAAEQVHQAAAALGIATTEPPEGKNKSPTSLFPQTKKITHLAPPSLSPWTQRFLELVGPVALQWTEGGWDGTGEKLHSKTLLDVIHKAFDQAVGRAPKKVLIHGELPAPVYYEHHRDTLVLHGGWSQTLSTRAISFLVYREIFETYSGAKLASQCDDKTWRELITIAQGRLTMEDEPLKRKLLKAFKRDEKRDFEELSKSTVSVPQRSVIQRATRDWTNRIALCTTRQVAPAIEAILAATPTRPVPDNSEAMNLILFSVQPHYLDWLE